MYQHGDTLPWWLLEEGRVEKWRDWFAKQRLVVGRSALAVWLGLGIIEPLELERTLKGYLVQFCCHDQGHLQGAQSPVSSP